MRIALFTPFSPDTGGGAVQLRSILPELQDLDICWYYLAPRETSSGQGRRHWLGPPISATRLLLDLFARVSALPVSSSAIKEIVGALEADSYWVVAHNEGVLVADELTAAGKNVHLTVHDDPMQVFSMSRKYRVFRRFISTVFARALMSSKSVDVISPGMRDLYHRLYKVDTFPLYRYLATLPPLEVEPDTASLRVGHIGTLYRPEPFSHFVAGVKSYAKKENKRLAIVRIGSSRYIDPIASQNPEIFENAGEVTEPVAINLLQACDFVYAMYPPGDRFERFRQTSLPMKLSTYIQAQRPIFAHSPTDSTLADTVAQLRLGVVCSSDNVGCIEDAVRKTLSMTVGPEMFEAARSTLLGYPQVNQIREALYRLNGSATKYSSSEVH